MGLGAVGIVLAVVLLFLVYKGWAKLPFGLNEEVKASADIIFKKKEHEKEKKEEKVVAVDVEDVEVNASAA